MKLTAISHLTATNKKHIKAMIDAKLNHAKVNRLEYKIENEIVFIKKYGNWLEKNKQGEIIKAPFRWCKLATLTA